ncbi:metal tolerance protein 2 [Balamuthia mandrillaris]
MAVEGEEEETEESLRQKLREQHEAAVRNEKKALQITWAGFAFNIVLAAGKGVAGFVGHSQALLADAFHSLSDSVSDAVTLWAVHTIKKPENYKYPYGYGKFETLGTFLVSATLVGTGIVLTQQCIDTVLLTIDTSHFHLPSLEDLFSNSNVDSTPASASTVGSDAAAVASEAAHSHAHSHSHHHGHSHIHWDPSQGPTNVALYGALGSILFKELLFQANLRIGQQAHSNLLIANAWHHRADAISSIIALVGIVGAQLGFTALDGLAGGVVGVMIIKMGADMALGSIYELVDSSVGTHDVRQDIVHTLRKSLRQLNHRHRQLSSAAASATPQKEERREEHNANTETNKKRNPNKELNRRHKVLLNYKNQDLRVRKLGTYFIADLRLEVNSRLGVAEADRLLKKVQSDLLMAVPRLKEVIVSFDVFDEQTGLILNSETVDLERLKKQPPREGLSQLQQQQSEGEKMKKEEEASSS